MTDFLHDSSSRQAEQNNLPAEMTSCSPGYCLTLSNDVTLLGSALVLPLHRFAPVGGLQRSLRFRAR